jgi:hypothetical protein
MSSLFFSFLLAFFPSLFASFFTLFPSCSSSNHFIRSNGYEIMYDLMSQVFPCFHAALVSYKGRENFLLILFFSYAFLSSHIVSTTSIY